MAESLSDGKQETTVTDLEEKAATNKPTELSASEIIENVSQAVCKVNDSETGFLSKFWRKDQLCYGLFTTNHVLNEEMLSSDQRVRISFMEEEADGSMKETMIHLANTFRFTCSLLDVTSIRFDEKLIEAMTESNHSFLPLHSSWTGKEGDLIQLMIVQNLSGGRPEIATSTFSRLHGFDIFHKGTSSLAVAGSPVITQDGKVVGIQKCRALKSEDHCNIAVSSKAVFDALDLHDKFSNKLVCNPRELSKSYEEKVLQQNLERAPDDQMVKYLVYVSPATKIIGLTTITPIWFVPTSHGWYWTPTDPFDDSSSTNWMSVNNLRVIGGFWNNLEPANKNVIIINWLQKSNMEYS